MPGRVVRKVITKKGHVTLPKAYRDYHGIQQGDDVLVEYDSVLVVVPNGVKLNGRKKKALKELLEG